MSSKVKLTRIQGFRLVTRDLQRAALFYESIGFEAGEPRSISRTEMAVLGIPGKGVRLPVRLGESLVELDRFDCAGRCYPANTNAADLLFQHLAIVTDDAAAAWDRAQAAGAHAISRNGPVELPQSAGGVTAIKFRDPEGHPLEFLRFPPGTNSAWDGNGIMRIDHSAISVADVSASLRFYTDHGLNENEASLNHGPTQVALDDLADVRVDVLPLTPSDTPPHLELLRYCTPVGRPLARLAPNDIAATRIVWCADTDMLLRDPDGHLHQLTCRGP